MGVHANEFQVFKLCTEQCRTIIEHFFDITYRKSILVLVDNSIVDSPALHSTYVMLDEVVYSTAQMQTEFLI